MMTVKPACMFNRSSMFNVTLQRGPQLLCHLRYCRATHSVWLQIYKISCTNQHNLLTEHFETKTPFQPTTVMTSPAPCSPGTVWCINLSKSIKIHLHNDNNGKYELIMYYTRDVPTTMWISDSNIFEL